jgi:hypothetical protein
MKIDTSRKISNLRGEPYKTSEGDELTLGAVCAEALATHNVGGKMKAYSLAHRCFGTKGELEVDQADLTLIKGAVEACSTYNNLITGQALEMLAEAK